MNTKATTPHPNALKKRTGILAFFRSPEPFFRIGAKWLVRILYRCEFQGFSKNIPEEGPAVLICNHVSYVDGLIINAACNRPVRFIIDEEIYKVPAVKYFMDLNRAIPILPTRSSVKHAISEARAGLEQGDLIVIFPEGFLTYTGNMMRFRFGVEWIVKDMDVPVIPIALGGIWGSVFSRKYRRTKWRMIPRSFRRKIVAICGKPIPAEKARINHMQREVMILKNKAINQLR